MKAIAIDSPKKNKIFVIYLSMIISLSIFWGTFIFWLVKMDIFWNLELFLLILLAIAIIIVVPCVFFVKSLIELIKNLNVKEKMTASKPYFLASIFIFIFIMSLSIAAFIYYFFPNGSIFYRQDDGPYLVWNDDPKTTMTVVWLTKEPSETVLKYGGSINNLNTIKDGLLTNLHIVPIKDLESDTKYYYKIPNFSDDTFWFRTAPEGSKSFNFTAISDTHAGYSDSHFEDVIDTMKNYDYDFIVHAGDAMGGASVNLTEWHTFFQSMVDQAKNHPFMIALGNHEYSGDIFGKNFKYFFPYDYVEDWGHYYSFDYSNAHFVMLDVFQNLLDWGGFLSEAQESWLRKDLKENKDKWLFVVMHASIYSTSDFNMNHKLEAQLAPIFYENEVDVVLSGHDHDYEAFLVNKTEEWGGTYYFVTGGGGGGLDEGILEREIDPWKEEWHNASIKAYQKDYVTTHNQLYGELVYHFLHFEVDDNNLHIRAVRENGTLIQEFYVKK